MKWFIVIIFFVVITLLFHKAAGTLNLKKMNIISYSYYSIIIFSYIGASLVYLGYREHYLIKKVISEEIINRTYYVVVYTAVLLGICVVFFNKIMSFTSIKKRYNFYLNKKVECKENGRNEFYIMLGVSIICITATAYVFYSIGYIPLFKIFDKSFDSAVARIEISRGFKGNAYIKNIFMLTITPILSYAAYIYYRVTKKREWLCLFVVLAIVCIFIKTHDFSKSPIMNYLIAFYLIEAVMGNIKSIKNTVVLGTILVGIILFQYTILGSGDITSYLTVYSGPLGRIFMTQIATLFLHIQAFPMQSPYLNGASMPTILTKIAGLDRSWVRSGRVVMELYNRAGVESGTAGVMNTLFVGEAYANWGWLGVLLAPIFVAFILSFIFNFLLRLEKNPLNITLYIELFQTFTTCLQGGFVDFLYNAVVLIVIVGIKGIQLLANRGVIRLRCRK